MRRSLSTHAKTRPPRVVAVAGLLPRHDDEAQFSEAVAAAINKQMLRSLSDHMEAFENAARSVDESELEIIDDIPDRQ